MAASPVAVLCILAIYVAFYAVFTAGGSSDDVPDLDTAAAADIDPDPGVIDVLNGVASFVGFIVGALTFNVEGAPPFIRLPLAVAIISSLAWSIATLFRGN